MLSGGVGLVGILDGLKQSKRNGFKMSSEQLLLVLLLWFC